MLQNVGTSYAGLSDHKRIQFLAFVSFHLTELAREQYPEAGNEPIDVVRGLRQYHELIQAVSVELLAVIGRHTSEEADAGHRFLKILAHVATRTQFESAVKWAFLEAFRQVGVQCGD
jgi:hypothetical protein